MLHDYRTKPADQWTFYVVDHLPTMKNIYRFDTVEEAMEKYQSLPKHLRSAIGSSIQNLHEIDHIHRRSGQNVLVMDSQNVDTTIWRESQEIQDAIDKMIAELRVRHQLSNMFGSQYPSVVVELERYTDDHQDPYFSDKILRSDNSKELLTSIQEVYAEGFGWLARDDFRELLELSRPSRAGEASKDNFVDRLNINYVDCFGHMGQADISPREFMLLKAQTEKLLSPEKMASDLYELARDVDPYEAQDQADLAEQELQKMEKDIASGSFSPYNEFVSDVIAEGPDSLEVDKAARFLLARFNVMSPKEVRKLPLGKQIRNAAEKSGGQDKVSGKDIHKER